MTDRTIELNALPIRHDQGDKNAPDQLIVSLIYDMGGHNHFHNQVRPRGYAIVVRPVRVIHENGYQLVRSVLLGPGSGLRRTVKETSRFSQKTFDALASSAQTQRMADELVNVILRENGMALAQDNAA